MRVTDAVVNRSAVGPRAASVWENAVAALLGVWVIGGVYADGWAHVNVGGLDSFFTPWHGVLYSGFTMLVAWLAFMTWRRSRSEGPVTVPPGYGFGPWR